MGTGAAGRRKRGILIAVMALLCVLLAVCALAVGRYSVPLPQVVRILADSFFPLEQSWTDQMANVVLNVRLPRILGAVLVGGALSLSGAVYQGVFQNPLVSPDLLGVSSGACVGASVAILLHLPSGGVQLLALVFGVVAVVLSVAVARIFRQVSSITFVLSGIIVSGLFSSLQGVCKYLADVYDELPAIIYWTMGSLSTVSKQDIASVAPPILIATAILLVIRWRVNLLSLGTGEARTLGVHVGRTRAVAVLCSTVLTACAVCISGTIGWIGLIIPHLGRLLVGPDNRYLLPVSLFTGAGFLVVVDTLARIATSSEIPLSIITGLIGTPLFILLVARQRRQGSALQE